MRRRLRSALDIAKKQRRTSGRRTKQNHISKTHRSPYCRKGISAYCNARCGVAIPDICHAQQEYRIRAAFMRSGRSACHCKASGRKISIHAPRGGCDPPAALVSPSQLKFQSTHPAGDATLSRCVIAREQSYFNPRTPRGMRQPSLRGRTKDTSISIHAPRGGCDRSPPGAGGAG